ncbi:hypothetical protein KUCAC02_001249, partial [Chaenocephalus aceratus]
EFVTKDKAETSLCEKETPGRKRFARKDNDEETIRDKEEETELQLLAVFIGPRCPE